VAPFGRHLVSEPLKFVRSEEAHLLNREPGLCDAEAGLIARRRSATARSRIARITPSAFRVVEAERSTLNAAIHVAILEVVTLRSSTSS
jgi:hypothetical protein